MVLESTMICVDDSDYMRNGDFTPTRMAAMQDAVQVVCNAKTRANPENNVGLLTLASSEVLSTLTIDPNKLISKLLAVQPEGELKLMSGLRVAHLALKHRQGKNHKMRIIVFIGSPVDNLNSDELVRLAKKFKKEKVNVDIVSFGDGAQDTLQKFIDTLNGEDGTNSRLVVVPPGPTLTSALVGSPILMSEDGIHLAGAGGGHYDFGIDPNDDPELALALRVSMEEQRARQEADTRSSAPEGGAETGTTHEEHMLEQALAMSMVPGGASASSTRPAAPVASASMDLSAMSEDQQIAYALQMSMQDTTFAQEPAASAVKMEQEDLGSSDDAGVAVGGSLDSEDVEMEDVEQAAGVKVEDDEEVSTDFKNVMQDTEFLQRVLEDLPEGTQIKKETVDSAKNLIKEKEKKGNTSKPTGSSSAAATAAKAGSKTSSGASTANASKKKPEEKKKPEPKKNVSVTGSSVVAPKKSSGGNNDKKKPDPKKK